MGAAIATDVDGKRSVLGRAFDILDCFFTSESEQTISTLCHQTGLPPATVHRMLASLVEWGAIERTSRGHYRLGMRLWRLGWGVPGARQVRDVARPHMVDLYSATREIVVLASRHDGDLLLVDQIAGRSSGAPWVSARRVPLGTLAPGLIFLANLPVGELRALVAEGSVHLPAELMQKEFLLLRAMAEIRAHGVATTEDTSGRRTWVSAPVFDETGAVRTTLSVVVPTERVTLAHADAVRQAARAVSEGLGANRSHVARTAVHV